jgi:hypothetical protein
MIIIPIFLLSRSGSRLGYSPAKLMLYLVHSYTEALHHTALVLILLKCKLLTGQSGEKGNRRRSMVQYAKDGAHTTAAS